MPNFMLRDLAGALRAIYLLPLFLLIPGYTLAWLLDLFDFRRRTGPFRLVFSIPFSMAICPVATYLLARFGTIAAVWAFYWVSAVGFGVLQLSAFRKDKPRGPGYRGMRVFGVIVVAWMAISLGSLIDLQIGERLYYPVSSIENSVPTAFVHAISTTGIPPQNPFFNPGSPAPLRYHYFWLMMCSLAEKIGNNTITPRQALAAGTFWCGVGFMALVVLYLRLFIRKDAALFRRRTLTAALLLGITGLDILPTLFLVILWVKGAANFVLPSVEWWNEHIDWFIYTALWAPHALSSLLAGLMGFLLLWKAPEERTAGGMARYVLPAGVALATALGASLYVAFVMGVFLVVWTGVTLWKRWFRETAALAAAGAACLITALPYLMSFETPAASLFGGHSPIELTVRAFSFTAFAPHWPGMSPTAELLALNLPLLPMNYLLELGLFFFVGTIQWRRFRRRGEPLSREELACTTMAVTSILICTFLRSNAGGANDLGWRGFLPAQFVLLLWAVDIVSERKTPGFLTARQRRLLMAFLALGVLGEVYDLVLTRVYPILADRGVVPTQEWMSPDRQFGERTYATRVAYEWARSMTPENAVIQYNPAVAFQETAAMLYADRRTVAADTRCNASYGGNPSLCAPIVSQLSQIYPPAGQPPAPPGLHDVCQRLPIDLMVAKDTDAVWKDRESWVWRQKPVYGNRYVRLFSCGESEPTAQIP